MPISTTSFLDAHRDIGLYFLGFVLALLGSLLLTFVVRERARRVGLFDPTDERKVHTSQIPRVGGVAIFWSVALTLLAIELLAGDRLFGETGGGLAIVLAGAAAIHGIGLWDDVRPMRARWKFAAQIAIALGVYFAGVQVSRISLPGVGVVELGAGAGLLFTVVWLVGITNAFNLIDGLDGLASGAAMFALTTMFVVASINGQNGAAVVTLVVAGATLGFLFYNFHPATIFLGDSGSLFLGFMLAGIGLISSQKSQTVVAVAIPVVSLGLPVLDTIIAITRRFIRGQPIFAADRGHIHHRLLGLGHSPRKVALLLYGACALLALGGMLLVNDSGYVALVLVLIGLGVFFAVQRLRFHEFEELARMVKRGVHQRHAIGRSVRIREATSQLVGLTEIPQLFQALERTFAADEYQRAEIRLRPSFVERELNGATRDRRLEDDLPVWTWCRNGATNPAWWEIKLPLLDLDGQRIGSFVLWQDAMASETSLSHVHTIARELRRVIQSKLLELWHPGILLTAVELDSAEAERVLPLIPAAEAHRRHDEVTLASEALAARAVDRKAESRTARPRAS